MQPTYICRCPHTYLIQKTSRIPSPQTGSESGWLQKFATEISNAHYYYKFILTKSKTNWVSRDTGFNLRINFDHGMVQTGGQTVYPRVR